MRALAVARALGPVDVRSVARDRPSASAMAAGTPSLASRLPAQTTSSSVASDQVPSTFVPEWIALRPAASTAVTWRYSMWLALAARMAIASGADAPSSIRSRARGPRVGSVTF